MEDWSLQVSFKTPAGTMVNVRGNTPEEIQTLLIGVGELAVEVVGIEQKYAGVHNVAPLSTGSSTGTQSSTNSSEQAFPTTPPTATAPAGGPTCIHGTRKYIASKPGAAKHWAMWACPTPKDAPGKCEPIWVN